MDPAGYLWLTVKPQKWIIRVSPKFKITAYALNDDTAGGIMIGPDGNVWFVEASHVGRLTPAGVLTEFNTGTSQGESGIAWARGLVWIRGQWYRGSGLVALNPKNGNVVAYSAPVYDGGAIINAQGSLWCASGSSGGALPLVQFNLKIKAVTTYQAPTSYDPYGAPNDMALANDGALWYATQRLEQGRVVGGGLVRFDLSTKQFTTYPSPPGYGWQWDVAIAPNGIWATSAFAVVVLNPKK
jgi:streptogramin lyase